MLMSGSALKGYAIEASDGRIGTVKDVLFDDRNWRVRWLIVDAGSWLIGRLVLVHPSSIVKVDHERLLLPVKLSMAQVKSSPNSAQDEPVSRQMENSLYDYYGWDPVWGGSIFGGGSMTQAFGTPFVGGTTLRQRQELKSQIDDGDPHLRSVDAVVGYHIKAKDGEIGHVQDFLVDDADWGIRYMIVDTRNWWPGRHVLISPYAVTGIDWPDRQVTLEVTCDEVKSSPAWEPTAVVDRAYEVRLHTHYSWPGYGW